MFFLALRYIMFCWKGKVVGSVIYSNGLSPFIRNRDLCIQHCALFLLQIWHYFVLYFLAIWPLNTLHCPLFFCDRLPISLEEVIPLDILWYEWLVYVFQCHFLSYVGLNLQFVHSMSRCFVLTAEYTLQSIYIYIWCTCIVFHLGGRFCDYSSWPLKILYSIYLM